MLLVALGLLALYLLSTFSTIAWLLCPCWGKLARYHKRSQIVSVHTANDLLKLLRLLQSNQPALSGILPNWSNKNWVHMSMTCQYTAQTSWFQLYFLLLRDLQQFCGCTVCLLAAMHVLKLLCCTNNSSRCVFKF